MKPLVPLLLLVGVAFTKEINLVNNCEYTVWPGLRGIFATDDHPANGGFILESGNTRTITVDSHWSGRIWPRTNCDEVGNCETGDCGGKIECNGSFTSEPVTAVEVSLGQRGLGDFYDISLIAGFNVPASVGPKSLKRVDDCGVAKCEINLNEVCPEGSRVTNSKGETVACSNECGQEEDPNVCKDTVFKKNCPNTTVSMNDDIDEFFYNCKTDYDFEIVFCP